MAPSNPARESDGGGTGRDGLDDGPGETPASRPDDERTSPGDGSEKAARPLSAPVRRTLVELAVALHRYAMYPSGHPALRPAADEVLDALGVVLRESGILEVEGLRDRVRVGDSRSDPASPHLSALAARLHAHQLTALRFRPGVDGDELADFLRVLSDEPDRGAEPVGLREEADRRWNHIDLVPQSYDPLRLDEEGRSAGERPGTTAEARLEADGASLAAPLGVRIGPVNLVAEDPEEAARRIEEVLGQEEPDRVVAYQIMRLAERLSTTRGQRADVVRRRMSRLILCLQPETLSYLLRFGAEGGREEDFLVSAAGSLDIEAALRLVRAAAHGREGSIEDWLLRIVKKLAMYAGPKDSKASRRPKESESHRASVHDFVDRIVSDWKLEDPRPTLYQQELQRIARTLPAEGAPVRRRARIEPDRIVQMGLEMDEPAGTVQEAADRILAERRARDLVGMVDGVAEPNRAATALWARLAVPETVEGLLHEPNPDFDLLSRIVLRGGVSVAGPLLDALSDANAESRLYWHNVFALLVDVGPPVAELVPDRLDDDRWFVRRNLLALLHELRVRPEGFSALPLLEDPDSRVRAEALRLAVEEPGGRLPALGAGLRDANERVVGLALSAAATGPLPEALEPRVAALATERGLAPALRSRAVRILGASRSEAARRTLLRIAWVRRWIFWRRLADTSGPVLAALEALAEGWPDHQEVGPVLEAAVRSDDPRVRETVGGAGEEEAVPGEVK